MKEKKQTIVPVELSAVFSEIRNTNYSHVGRAIDYLKTTVRDASNSIKLDAIAWTDAFFNLLLPIPINKQIWYLYNKDIGELLSLVEDIVEDISHSEVDNTNQEYEGGLVGKFIKTMKPRLNLYQVIVSFAAEEKDSAGIRMQKLVEDTKDNCNNLLSLESKASRSCTTQKKRYCFEKYVEPLSIMYHHPIAEEILPELALCYELFLDYLIDLDLIEHELTPFQSTTVDGLINDVDVKINCLWGRWMVFLEERIESGERSMACLKKARDDLAFSMEKRKKMMEEYRALSEMINKKKKRTCQY